jgi:hypothetical protein
MLQGNDPIAQLNTYRSTLKPDLECLVILEDVFAITPAVEAIINWAMHYKGVNILVTSRYEYDGLPTSVNCSWKPAVTNHIFHLTPDMMMTLPTNTHDSKGHALDKQLFLKIAYEGQDSEVRFSTLEHHVVNCAVNFEIENSVICNTLT